MLLSSLKTGSTDLRDTEVQQPNTAATLFLLISSRAFSANNGQLEAGSTTTASSFLPSRPPFLFCSSINISITSFSVVLLMAMVPEGDWRMPPLMVSCAWAGSAAASPSASPAVAASAWRNNGRRATVRMGLSIAFFLSVYARRGRLPVRSRGSRKERGKPEIPAKVLRSPGIGNGPGCLITEQVAAVWLVDQKCGACLKFGPESFLRWRGAPHDHKP